MKKPIGTERKRSIGRLVHHKGEHRGTLTIRLRDQMRTLITKAASLAGRSLSEEIEFQLEAIQNREQWESQIETRLIAILQKSARPARAPSVGVVGPTDSDGGAEIVFHSGGDKSPLVYSVPEAGAMLGISRNSAYEAAANGDIPTIRIGKRLLVPRVAFDQILNSAGKKTP